MFDDYLLKIEHAVFDGLPKADGEISGMPEMMKYSLESGGKRVRPLLCLLFCAMCGGDPDAALPFAAGIEYVHTYSLIHDDLPCMDNDDFRRGKPSSHKRFGEANALLTGDALLTHAFSLLTDAAQSGLVSAAACLRAVRELSFLSGISGMVGGQYIDLASEGKMLSGDGLFLMDSLKTGALIEASCMLGCIAAGADASAENAVRVFARNLGIAFQITDDVLEFESGEDDSDERNHKATYVSVFGAEEAKRLAEVYTQNAISALDYFGDRADDVRSFAALLLKRQK